MRIKNNAGYTLIEMLIVLSITSSILLFFTHSLLNNFRLVRKYKNTSLSYIKLQVLNRVRKDFEMCFLAKINEDQLELEIPFSEEENRFSVSKVEYQMITNQLVRKETGEEEKIKTMDLGGLVMNMDWEIVSNASNLVMTYTDTNGQSDSYSIGILSGKGLK